MNLVPGLNLQQLDLVRSWVYKQVVTELCGRWRPTSLDKYNVVVFEQRPCCDLLRPFADNYIHKQLLIVTVRPCILLHPNNLLSIGLFWATDY